MPWTDLYGGGGPSPDAATLISRQVADAGLRIGTLGLARKDTIGVLGISASSEEDDAASEHSFLQFGTSVAQTASGRAAGTSVWPR